MNHRILWLLLVLSICRISAADELVLDDGSRLVGAVKAISAEIIELETDWAGTIQVRRERVVGLTTESDWRVVFESGERIIGSLAWSASDGQRVVSERVGNVALDVGAVTALEDPSAPVVQTPEQRAAAVWSSEVSLAINGASGNTEEFSANPRFSALRETEFDRLRFGLQGRFASQDGEETENEVIGNVGLERDFTERWFALGNLRLERDELENLDLRANLDLGVGYFLIRQEKHEFKPRFGIGVQSESFEDGTTNEDLVGVAGWDYRIDLNSRWRFTHVLDYRPTFSDPTRAYRLDSEAALVTLLNDHRWGLSFRLRNEYNADPEPGIDELDTVYSVGIQRVFK